MMYKATISLISSLLVYLTATYPVSATPTTPVDIRAEQVEYLAEKDEIIYSKNVQLLHKQSDLQAESLHIYAPKGEIQRCFAKGSPATLKTITNGKKILLSATTIEWDWKQQIVFLKKNVTVVRDDNYLHSDSMEYDMRHGKVKAFSADGNRMHTQITPPAEAR